MCTLKHYYLTRTVSHVHIYNAFIKLGEKQNIYTKQNVCTINYVNSKLLLKIYPLCLTPVADLAYNDLTDNETVGPNLT